MHAAAIHAHIELLLLELFWQYVERGEDRLELLKLYAAQPVSREQDWNRQAVRDEASTITLDAHGCFCCRTEDRRLYWHHVVQVQHGGSNSPRNRVAICYRCHALIHPWLPKNRKGEELAGEWWSLSDVAEDLQRRETSLGDVTERASTLPSNPTTPELKA